MKTYFEKLKDPRWQRKRLEIMQRDDFKCLSCDDSTQTLNVHHAYYVTGRNPWDYPSWSLSTLCQDCHKDTHRKDDCREEDENSTRANVDSWEEVIGFLGISRIHDFDRWWDFSTSLAIRKEEFEERGITPIEWLEWAYLELSAKEFVAKNGGENPLR
jgi:hypothetical protein